MDNQEAHKEEIKEIIRITIDKAVNGKIDKLNMKLDQYIQDDTEWKEKAKPVLQMGENVQGFGKVSLYIVGFVASVASAILVVINLFNKK